MELGFQRTYDSRHGALAKGFLVSAAAHQRANTLRDVVFRRCRCSLLNGGVDDLLRKRVREKIGHGRDVLKRRELNMKASCGLLPTIDDAGGSWCDLQTDVGG